MQLHEFEQTYLLGPLFSNLVDDFVGAGWRIIETKKVREVASDGSFEDKLTILLGATKGATVPPSVKEAIRITAEVLRA